MLGSPPALCCFMKKENTIVILGKVEDEWLSSRGRILTLSLVKICAIKPYSFFFLLWYHQVHVFELSEICSEVRICDWRCHTTLGQPDLHLSGFRLVQRHFWYIHLYKELYYNNRDENHEIQFDNFGKKWSGTIQYHVQVRT